MMSDSLVYLTEIRSRLLRALVVFFLVLIGFALFSKALYYHLVTPLFNAQHQPLVLIATSVPSVFTAPLKLAFYCASMICMPYFLFEIWTYISEALYPKERRLVCCLLVVSIVLFYMGVLFCYFLVLPIIFKFFIHLTPSYIEFKPDVSLYLQFNFGLMLSFGMAFECPVIVVALTWLKVFDIGALKQARPYVVVLSLVVGMLFTPPDVISQILLAVPLYLLYELGIFFSECLSRRLGHQVIGGDSQATRTHASREL